MHIAQVGNPSDPGVLFLHGAGVAGWMWQPVLHRLHGVGAVVPDLPGHGASAAEPFPGLSATVAGLAARLDRPMVVVGFSWGAQLALELTAHHPELVRASIIISGLAQPLPGASLYDRLVAATLPLTRSHWFARLQAHALGVPDGLINDYVATSAGLDLSSVAQVIAQNNRYRVPQQWSDGDTPALVVCGSREPRSERVSAHHLHRARPGSRLVIMAGARHDIPFRAPGWLAMQVQSLADSPAAP